MQLAFVCTYTYVCKVVENFIKFWNNNPQTQYPAQTSQCVYFSKFIFAILQSSLEAFVRSRKFTFPEYFIIKLHMYIHVHALQTKRVKENTKDNLLHYTNYMNSLILLFLLLNFRINEYLLLFHPSDCVRVHAEYQQPNNL